jgi:hypothetical protein
LPTPIIAVGGIAVIIVEIILRAKKLFDSPIGEIVRQAKKVFLSKERLTNSLKDLLSQTAIPVAFRDWAAEQFVRLARRVPEFLSAPPADIRDALASAFSRLTKRKADRLLPESVQDQTHVTLSRKLIASELLKKVSIDTIRNEAERRARK